MALEYIALSAAAVGVIPVIKRVMDSLRRSRVRGSSVTVKVGDEEFTVEDFKGSKQDLREIEERLLRAVRHDEDLAVGDDVTPTDDRRRE